MHPISPAHRRWRIATLCLIVLWLATVGALGYQLADLGDQVDDLTVSSQSGSASFDILARLVPVVARSARREEFLTMLRQQNPTAFVVATDSSVAIDQLTFRFDGSGALQRVLPFYAP
jgi:hypothetical protein